MIVAPPFTSVQFGVSYPTNPSLRYKYPEPTADILVNICSALLSVPKFYTQVLHLMNKFNLVPPFTPASTVPSTIVELVKKIYKFSGDFEIATHPNDSESESEYESGDSRDGDQLVSLDVGVPERVLKTRKRKKNILKTDRKRQRLQEMAFLDFGNKNRTEISHDAQLLVTKKRIDIKVPTVLDDKSSFVEQEKREQTQEPEIEGFGKMPSKKQEPDNTAETKENSEIAVLKDFITEKQLESGRISDKEIAKLPLFKNYSPGGPACRLYVKNLSKKVTEKDLSFIFGRFVNFHDEGERNMFNIQLLTQGRMKGQAFVGLPSIESAIRAVKATNGYQLISKPMVVHFARSKKPT